ncbi:tetratricopeptide repeat protein [Rubripirellula obstinata]|uniref:Tetratricopeptide repeat protein n=1 Tax=Rubripirellula obstinata TaxID=406547 RepID=A0A5B1CST7_9BACT|nr:tetratricopeptide repeat protein [Rubripirellula obstinata]KAA1262473.1 tetratricopeptide repeat protein [Rubripirellula obstinata]
MLALDRFRFSQLHALIFSLAFPLACCVAFTPCLAQELGVQEVEPAEVQAEPDTDALPEVGSEVDPEAGPKVGEGQSDLEEAIVKRIDAESDEELEATAALLESAITKGLDGENESFAKKMLGSVLLQRAQKIAAKIPAAPGRQKLAVRDEALEVLTQAVENDPELVEGFLLIARLNLMGGGDKDAIYQATTNAIKLLADEPTELSSALVLRALTRDDQPSRLEDLDAAIKADSKNKEALQLRAQLRLQTGDISGAVEDLDSVLELDPTNLVVAQAAINKLIELERVKDAITLITRTLSAQPSEGMYRLRAVLYQADGEAEKAMSDLDKAIAMAPKDPRTLLLRATVALDRDDVKAAKADFRAAAAIAPQIMGADQGIELRLQIALKENRMADAINDAKLLVDREPDNLFRRMRLASLYSIDKRPRKAIELLTSLLQKEPENVAALRSRGDAYLSVGDHAAAIADYESAISALGKVDAENSTQTQIDEASGLYNNLAWVLSTSPNDAVRNGTRALELAEMSASLTKYEAPHILSTLAAAYAESGDFEKAREWSQKAVELATDEEHDQLKQLQEELDAYLEDKPWREVQETEENDLPILDPKDLIDT